jgi:hypothetical protein
MDPVKDSLIATVFVLAGVVITVILSVGLMKWSGAAWSDECRDMGGVVVEERIPGGPWIDTYSCVIDGAPVDWERF